MAQRVIYSDDTKVQDVVDITIGADGSILTAGSNTIDAISPDALNKNFLDEIAFMEEEMEIMVNESSDENAENPVMVGCNGAFRQFWRGQVVTAKRKFVDCLIVKSGRVTTPEYINQAGERARSIKQQSAHKYPFMVISDRNPKGAEWIRRRLAEPI